MTLRLRLLLATFVLCATALCVMGGGLRGAWRRTEEARFEREFAAATDQLESDLVVRSERTRALLESLCLHDPLVDSALIGLVSGDLAPRVHTLRLRVPELARALGMDELALVTDRGEVLAGTTSWARGPAGREDPGLAALLVERLERPGVAASGAPLSTYACRQQRSGRWVGLLASESIVRSLAEAEKRYGLRLVLTGPADGSHGEAAQADELERTLSVPSWSGRELRARRDRIDLRSAFAALDARLIAVGAVALGLALLVAVALSRGLARPVVAFAERARLAVDSEPEPLPLVGGPELVSAARAFNQTLRDLSALRERLAVTERIAARREVARQIAHEIKNPLSPIRGAIETLRRLKQRGSSEFDGYFDEATRTVLGEVSRIDQLVRAFSQYANLPRPEPTRFELAELVRELVQLHRALGVDISLETTGDTFLLADRNQLAQVITNLLKNAIEACSAPSPASSSTAASSAAASTQVRVRTRRLDADHVEVRLSDNGPGVPAELRDRLFEPYVTSKPQGTGLGLAMSQRIAVEHGGTLALDAEVGPGATFVLILPTAGPPTSI
ncbi:MAG TPA: ATP-binding protein [Polyangiaceae bacterium]|nr:ATP-binding protein [Polyangiaceae bacterium]